MQHYKLLTTEQKEAFDIIEPYFPNNTQQDDYYGGGILVDSNQPYSEGGTWLCNYNLTIAEATIVADTIREMKCASKCIFTFLYPNYYSGFSPTNSLRVQVMIEAANRHPDKHAVPPYFGVHCTSTSPSCVATFRQLTLQNLLSNEEFMKTEAGRVPDDILSDSADVMKQIMMKQK